MTEPAAPPPNAAPNAAALPGIDHVVILVRDLDAAEAAFRRLGLTPTPRGFHSIGTRNHCLMFGTDYLELLSVVTPHPVTAYFSAFLAEREGAAAIAFASDDADATWRGFVARGLAADPPVDFSRPVDTADGPRDARFRVVQLPVDATPGCRAFVCQHFTRELVWLPAYQSHPLGVTGIDGLDITAADPAAAARDYARVAGSTARRSGDAWEVPLAGATLRLQSAPAGQHGDDAGNAAGDPAGTARIAAIRLRVADVAAALAVLDDRGIAVERPAGGPPSVPPDAACGVRLVLLPTANG